MDLQHLLELAITKAGLLTPLVVGIVQGIKQAGLPDRVNFPVSLATGVLLAELTGLALPDPSWAGAGRDALTGLVAGLAASGLYSGVQSIRKP